MQPPPASARTLAGLLLLAAALRLVAWMGAPMMDDLGPDHLWLAQRLLAGDSDAVARHPCPPGYAAATAALALALRDVHAGALLVSILSGVLATWAAWSLARDLLPAAPRAAVGASLLACVHGASVTRSSDIHAESLGLALFAGTCALLLGAVRRGRWRWPLAGTALGLALVTSPAGLPLLLAAAAALVGAAWRLGPRTALAAACLAAPAILLPAALPGDASVTRGVGAPRDELPPDCPLASPVVPSGNTATSPRPDRPAHPAAELAGAAGWDMLALAVVGVAACWRASRASVLTGMALLAVSLLVGGHTSTHHVPAGWLGPAQLLLLPAGAGLAWLWDAPRLRAAARAAAVGLVAWQAVGGLAERRPEDEAWRGALALAQAATTPDQAIASGHRKHGWYAGRRVLVVRQPCPDGEPEAAMAREGAALLLVEESWLEREQAGLRGPTRYVEIGRFTAGATTVLVLKPLVGR